MIKLGTHNSLSYLPCQWYLRLFSWIGKCQSLNIEEQYKKGVRFFDIRIKYVNGKTMSGHGLLTYKVDIENILEWLNSKYDCTVRLFLENNKKNPTKDFNRFENDIKNWISKYKNIVFTEGGCRYNYKRFINDKLKFDECYWKFGYTLIPYPKYWAKHNNYRLHHGDNEIKFRVYDFIDIY